MVLPPVYETYGRELQGDCSVLPLVAHIDLVTVAFVLSWGDGKRSHNVKWLKSEFFLYLLGFLWKWGTLTEPNLFICHWRSTVLDWCFQSLNGCGQILILWKLKVYFTQAPFMLLGSFMSFSHFPHSFQNIFVAIKLFVKWSLIEFAYTSQWSALLT